MWWMNREIGVYGFMSWFVPFLVSCMFFGPDGGLMVDIKVFKTFMVAVFSVCGALLLDRIIGRLIKRGLPDGESYTALAVQVGVFFMVVNCLLDVVLLIPIINFSNAQNGNVPKMTVSLWFFEIGAGYVAILAQAWLAGRMADAAASAVDTTKDK